MRCRIAIRFEGVISLPNTILHCLGRVPRQSPKVSATNQNSAAQLRLNRKNNAKQAQIKKRNALVSATRLFSGVDGAPRIVAVIPLTSDVQTSEAVKGLAASLELDADDVPEKGIWKMRCVAISAFFSPRGNLTSTNICRADRFKTSLQFITVPYRDFYGALEACRVADYTVLVLSPTQEVDEWGDTLLRTLQAQGLPTVVSIVADSEDVDSKARSGILKSLLSFVQYFVPSQKKVYDLHSNSDRLNALRALSEGRPEDVRWREGRSYIVGEEVEWAKDDGEGEEGTLKVTGVVRGATLSANRLVHIPDFGDYQISKVRLVL